MMHLSWVPILGLGILTCCDGSCAAMVGLASNGWLLSAMAMHHQQEPPERKFEVFGCLAMKTTARKTHHGQQLKPES